MVWGKDEIALPKFASRLVEAGSPTIDWTEATPGPDQSEEQATMVASIFMKGAP